MYPNKRELSRAFSRLATGPQREGQPALVHIKNVCMSVRRSLRFFCALQPFRRQMEHPPSVEHQSVDQISRFMMEHLLWNTSQLRRILIYTPASNDTMCTIFIYKHSQWLTLFAKIQFDHSVLKWFSPPFSQAIKHLFSKLSLYCLYPTTSIPKVEGSLKEST